MLVSISSPVNDGILLYGWEPNTGTSVRETAVAAHRHITGEPRMMIPCYDSTTRAVRKSDSSQAEKERRAGSPRQLSLSLASRQGAAESTVRAHRFLGHCSGYSLVTDRYRRPAWEARHLILELGMKRRQPYS